MAEREADDEVGSVVAEATAPAGRDRGQGRDATAEL